MMPRRVTLADGLTGRALIAQDFKSTAQASRLHWLL